MTITVHAPGIGQFVGAGYAFDFRTDKFGPFPITAQWSAVAIALPQNTIVLEQFSPAGQQGVWPGTWYGFDSESGSAQQPFNGAAFGADISLQVRYVDTATATDIEPPQLFVTYAWDATGGLGFLLHHQSASGTFTDADRTLLSEIYDSTSVKTYSTFTTHVGLTDSGVVLTNSSTRALRVTVVTFPSNVIVDPGSPEYFFNLGFITINRAQGFVRSARLVFEHQTYPVEADTVAFGYTLRNGTVVNVEELQPST